ncbi:MAG TPA: TnsA endonuclease N-terminal domain-containing protein [Verrucomicrobiae bacterium]
MSTESRHGELAVAYGLEHDAEVLEFYDQPESIKLVYAARSGRATGVMHTPDFLVLRRSSVSFVEVKPEDRLVYLADAQPNRYQRDTVQDWRCPPGEEAAKTFGFSYSVMSTARINRVLVRNLEFLDDFLRGPMEICSELRHKLAGLVTSHPGISIEFVRRQLGPEIMDGLFTLIAAGEIYFDLDAQLLSDQETGQLFESKETAKALKIVGIPNPCPANGRAERINGHEIKADQVSNVSLVRTELLGTGQHWTSGGQRIEANDGVTGHSEALAMIQSASPKDIEIANERHAFVMDAALAKENGVPDRNLRRWRLRFRRAEELYGKGYLGLLPRYSRQGNHAARLADKIYEIADEVIRDVFMTPKRVSKMFVYGRFANRCQEAGLQPPSYVWLVKAMRKIKACDIKNAREGKRAAYQLEFSTRPLSAKNDNHGEYPWQVVHIDHTEVDLELVDETTGMVLGRPWLTLMFDAFSRRVLAFVLSFDAPSANSLKSIVRACVSRHSRVPSCLVLDWGKEFGSEFFETLTAIYEIRIIKRPPHQARFGTLIEREFGKLNKAFFHNLRGNTQNTKNVRQLTKALDPKGLAVWTLEALHENLAGFCFEIHDHRLHPGIGTTPAEAYERGIDLAGSRPSRRVAYDDVLKFLTMATTPRGAARVQPGLGVKIRYFHYWAEEMRDPQWERKEVAVRYDQDDLGVAYARLAGKWVRCVSCHYDALKGRSEKQLRIAVEELRRKRSLIEGGRTVTARQIARFFESVEGEEVLREQRMKDMARHRIIEAASEGPLTVAAASAEGGSGITKEPADRPVAPEVTSPAPAIGPVFDDF